MKDKTNYLDEKMCKRCGGTCCRTLPGSAFPCDFDEPLLDSLVMAFKSGKWAVDSWSGPLGDLGDDDHYFIRPKVKGKSNIYDESWGGTCIFLTENGCELKPEKRPHNCRMLEPKKKTQGKCKDHDGSKKQSAIEWNPHNKTIESAMAAVGE